MWSCNIHVRAKPIIRCAVGRDSNPQLIDGTASKKPMKKSREAGSTYDGLMRCVENWRVHGAVRSQPQTSHDGSDGNRLPMYQARPLNATNDSRLSRTTGDSGTGAIFSGRLMSRP